MQVQMKNLKTIICLCLTVSFSLSAAVKKNGVLSTLRDSLSVQSSKVQNLKASLHTIEKKIGKRNQTYLGYIKKIKEIQSQEVSLRGEITFNKSKIINIKNQLKTTFSKMVISGMDDSIEGVYQKLYLKNIYEKKIIEIKSLASHNKNTIIRLDEVNTGLNSLLQISSGLYDILTTLEDNKKHMANNYISELDEFNKQEKNITKKKLESYARKSRRQKRLRKNIANFKSPIKDYKKIKFGKKAITYVYDGVKPIFATETGKITYAGQLSTYGKLLIIDHGKDIRTILLGNFSAKVKRNQQVTKGQLVAYTNKQEELGSLHFEVRKNKKSQNTALWLESSSLKRKKI